MGWASFWHAVSHPIDSIKSAGSSVFHAAESAVHSGIDFVKHIAEKAAHFVNHLPPVKFVRRTAEKVAHAASTVGHAIASGAKSAVEFVKHTASTVADGVKEVEHGSENLGNSLLDMTKIIPYALAGGGALIAISMLNKRGSSYSVSVRFKKYVLYKSSF